MFVKWFSMFSDNLIQFSSFKNYPLTFANTDITPKNKAVLINTILDAG